jgi:peptidoglycan/LPS O-acetylase OafA/YrhL
VTTEPGPSLPSGRWLDTLRGLAATGVVFFHLDAVAPSRSGLFQAILSHCWLGVSAFFVLSGYLIVQAALRKPDWAQFLRRRWWRIYPPYLASIAVVLGVAAIRKISTGTNDVPNLPHGVLAWLAALTCTADSVIRIPAMNWVYWSLAAEIAYYGFIGLILALAPGRLATAFTAMTWLVLLPHLPPITHFFAQNWPLFALGATIAFDLRRPRTWLMAASCLIGLAVVSARGSQWSAALAAIASWLSIVWSRHSSGKWLDREQIFSRVGVVSYSLYLIHVPVGVYLCYPLIVQGSTPNPIAYAARTAAVYAVCLAFAWLFWRCAEKPSHERGRRA